MNQENCILIDWFAMSFRDPLITVHDIVKLLNLPFGFDDWKQLPGRYRYRDRISFNHISIYYNSVNPDCDFPLLEMTGQGCREFETFNPAGFRHLFDLARDTEKYHMSRLDVAFDDLIGIFDIQRVYDDYKLGNWVSNSKRGQGAFDMHRREKDHLGYSIMTGSKSSEMYMRIYDKAIERGFFDEDLHWVRLELVLKQDRATNFILNPAPIGEKLRGVVSKYFRFLTPSKTDSHRDRWKTRQYWLDFLGAVEPISVFTPKNIEYNFPRLQRYVMQQAGNSVETYLRCVGLYDFFNDLLHRGTKGLTPQQRFLVKECEHSFRENKQFTVEELKKILEIFGDQAADQSEDGEEPPAEADPFADIPLPDPLPLPSDWYDDF